MEATTWATRLNVALDGLDALDRARVLAHCARAADPDAEAALAETLYKLGGANRIMGVVGHGGTLWTSANIRLSLWERVRVLLGAPLLVLTSVETQHAPGAIERVDVDVRVGGRSRRLP